MRSNDSFQGVVSYGDTVGAERREKHPFAVIRPVDLHAKTFLLEASTYCNYNAFLMFYSGRGTAARPTRTR